MPDRDPYAAAVQRIGRFGVEQHGVDAERGRAAEQDPEVLVVVHPFDDRDPAGSASTDSIPGSGQRSAARDRAAVEVEADDPAQHRVRGHVDGRVGRDIRQNVATARRAARA